MSTRRIRHYAAALTTVSLLALTLAACGDGPAADDAPARSGPAAFPVTITDAAGDKVVVRDRPKRIVALFDVNVATLDEIGADAQIVGIDDFAAAPKDAPASLPRIGGDNFQFDAEAVVELEPDLVITSIGTEDALDQQLRDVGIQVLSLGYPGTIDATLDHVTTLGAVSGHVDEASALVDELRSGIDRVTDIAADTAPVKVYYETDASVSGKPYTVGPGSLIDELLARAGARNVFADASGFAPQVSFEAIVDAQPAVIVLADAKGFVGPRFLGAVTVDSVEARPGFDTIPAVRDDAVRPVRADELLVPGPRLAEGLAALLGAVHPELADEATAAAQS
ncbi:MAG: periplasmic binding protein [Thermoleophilia bacterium]|nr:periplasmic binding protein [Thermoleophilia bacterium]MCZ4496916.1 periplasmic binding protein [Thermoleophilia bacterium]